MVSYNRVPARCEAHGIIPADRVYKLLNGDELAKLKKQEEMV